MHTLIEELERRRVEQNVSKKTLAKLTGMSRHTIARKLSGETELTVDEAIAICKVLDTTLQEILDLLDTIAEMHPKGEK